MQRVALSGASGPNSWYLRIYLAKLDPNSLDLNTKLIQQILKEINPKYLLEGLMLKVLKL